MGEGGNKQTNKQKTASSAGNSTRPSPLQKFPVYKKSSHVISIRCICSKRTRWKPRKRKCAISSVAILVLCGFSSQKKLQMLHKKTLSFFEVRAQIVRIIKDFHSFPFIILYNNLIALQPLQCPPKSAQRSRAYFRFS